MTISRELLGKYLAPGDVFIETGTRWGDGCIRAAELEACEIYSCESDSVMNGLAKAHLWDAIYDSHYKIAFALSPKFLEEMGETIAVKEGNCVVVLDAHGNTSPLLEELSVIAHWPKKPKAILIDDMRCMPGWGINQEDINNHLQAIGDHRRRREHGKWTKDDVLVAEFI